MKPINITINDVSKRYKKTDGLVHVSTEFNAGHLHLLVGKNGSGKSTLLKCVMRHINYQGEIIKRRYRIGYAPEKYIMPAFMSVYQFLKSIGRIKDIHEPLLNLELNEYLNMFNMKDKLHHRIHQLSNGMKQKINLIQALLNHPKIILLDEPLVGLDKSSQEALIKHLIQLSKNQLVIVSSHFPQKFKTSRKMIHRFDKGKIIS